MKESHASDTKFIVFTFIAGVLYFFTGDLQLLSSLTGWIYPLIPANPIVGIVLISISLIFMTGTIHYFRNQRDAYAFMIVGMILAGIVFVLNVITILTNLLGWLLQYEDWITWTILNEISPGLLLFPIFAFILRVLKGSDGSLFEIQMPETGGM